MDQVRLGIIGTGWWAEMAYLSTLKGHPRAKAMAICGRNRERGRNFHSEVVSPIMAYRAQPTSAKPMGR